MAGEQGYGIKEVMAVTGVTYRQLDYWARTELVRPSVKDASGSGSQRLYSFRDILKVRVIKNLLDTGVELQKIRKAVEYLDAHDQDSHGVTLVSDGRKVYAEASPDALLDLLRHGQGVFAIAVDRVRTDLEKDLTKGRRRAARAGGT